MGEKPENSVFCLNLALAKFCSDHISCNYCLDQKNPMCKINTQAVKTCRWRPCLDMCERRMWIIMRRRKKEKS